MLPVYVPPSKELLLVQQRAEARRQEQKQQNQQQQEREDDQDQDELVLVLPSYIAPSKELRLISERGKVPPDRLFNDLSLSQMLVSLACFSHRKAHAATGTAAARGRGGGTHLSS